MNEKRLYRHELKYVISKGTAALIKQRLDVLMKKDPHTVGGKYKIRSLYFDDYWFTAYNEKLMGVYKRKKYRIRIYNDDDSVIKLECKHKADSYISKESASLAREETEAIIQGRYGFLLGKKNPLCHEFYYQCVSKVMRPVVIVDYEREPYICEAGDVRITFDSNIRATNVFENMFSSELPSLYTMDNNVVVMEVKFTEFMPEHIKRAISCDDHELVAVSKFVECFEKTNFAFLHNISGI